MTKQSGKAKEISLGEDVGDWAVKVNDARFADGGDGSILTYAKRDGKVCLGVILLGDKMPDGTIYAGISPDTNKPMYATPADAPLTYTFNEATKYTAKLDAHGHQDWRVPTKRELCVLYNNRAAIGGFRVTDLSHTNWYWSSSKRGLWQAWGQQFSKNGHQDDFSKRELTALRCVR